VASKKTRRKSQPADYERARRLVDTAVTQHAEEWAATIGLTPTDQFRKDVSEALRECIQAHIAAPLAISVDKEIRAGNAAATVVAASAAKKLRSVHHPPQLPVAGVVGISIVLGGGRSEARGRSGAPA
jgi:hypothetical protein